ncbi:hypothetical protein [Nocardia bovistercoris]|uniref:SWIM-type domain-containing protein n=1 Tax=Nocardia bovistercoris TaxID=2785916 RepID=A0A931N242_9NOCA|nr:hypothetical protein [Nocardia bovistercoris]MBH0775118.1 hypothetical protein [Nocardia bovistercoris]
MADNEFGYTAWGMDWVRLAEPLRATRPEPLLPRARSIARNGGVSAETEGRVVRAAIHRGGQASVTHVEVAAATRAAVTAVTGLLGAAGIVTDDTHRALLAEGHRPAPVLAATDCSCSARTPRCVHVLAVLYDTARRVDENPRLALELQGCFDASADDIPELAEAPRWTPIHTLDPADWFTPPDPADP